MSRMNICLLKEKLELNVLRKDNEQMKRAKKKLQSSGDELFYTGVLTKNIPDQKRIDALASLPLPYAKKNMDDDERKFGWSVLPSCLIPILREDMCLTDNTIQRMCIADPEHADIDYGIWQTESYDNEHNISLSLISCCIKDDLQQTLGELALRVSFVRKLPFLEVARHLAELRKNNKLGYFQELSTGDMYYKHWHPSEQFIGSESRGLSDTALNLLHAESEI